MAAPTLITTTVTFRPAHPILGTHLSPTNNCAVLKGSGSANPFGVQQGESTTLTVIVSPGSDPTSTGITVTADLSSIGGSPTQSFAGSGNTFTFFATVSPATPLGNKLLPVTITDDQARMASTTIALVVQQPHIVISQIYGGGGNTSATYTNDFVELYNPTSVDFDLTGWSLQYASATGDGWEFTRQPLGGTIEPGEYYLIALGSGGAVGLATAPRKHHIAISTSAVRPVSSRSLATSSRWRAIARLVLRTSRILSDMAARTAPRPRMQWAPVTTQPLCSARTTAPRTLTTTRATSLPAHPIRAALRPLLRLGPSVFGTDPRNNATSAPRDATISINFTEPVTVDKGWYDITCVSSNNHNSATVRSFFGGETHTITPNVNFTPGEQCTVTIFKDAVHDVDLDDTGTNADSLPANKVFTFTVATGTAPPYPFSVHLTMGNPNGATADLGQPDNYLMEKPEFSLSYNRTRGTANWVSWHLADEWIGTPYAR